MGRSGWGSARRIGRRVRIRAQKPGPHAQLVHRLALGDAGQVLQLAQQLRIERGQDRHHALGLGLEQIDKRVACLDLVHHLHHQLRAGIGHPGLGPQAKLGVAADAAQLFVVGDVPAVDLVAVQAQHRRIAHLAAKPGAVGHQQQPGAGCRIVAGQCAGQVLARPGQGQFDVVVAQVDHQPPALGGQQPGKSGKHRRKAGVGQHPVDFGQHAVGIKTEGGFFGQEVDEVAIDHQRGQAGRGRLRHRVDQPDQLGGGRKDLEPRLATEVQVRHHLQLVQPEPAAGPAGCPQSTVRHRVSPLFGWCPPRSGPQSGPGCRLPCCRPGGRMIGLA